LCKQNQLRKLFVEPFSDIFLGKDATLTLLTYIKPKLSSTFEALEASMEALVLSRARSSNGSGNCSEVEVLRCHGGVVMWDLWGIYGDSLRFMG
jgi:hypothetical protein